jgi:triosephosphate isomerase
MRTPIIAGNWKMHKSPAESEAFVQDLLPALAPYSQVESVVIPTYTALAGVQAALAGSSLHLGAQDIHHEEQGAYTSSIAASMLVGLVEYVIVGHSETRQYLSVTDEKVNAKVKLALKYGFKPIIAMGESLQQKQAGQTEAVCQTQIQAAFKDIPAEALPQIVIAYEPIWAIGTGLNADAALAQQVIGAIRATVRDLYGEALAAQVRIQYGGSVKPDNMLDYMRQPDIDGALVGGASLKVADFTELVKLAAQAKGLA